MRQTTEVFIPIPKVRNTHCKVEIAGDDQTSRMISSKFIYPTTIGIGTFIMNLSNAFGQLTGKYQAGDVVFINRTSGLPPGDGNQPITDLKGHHRQAPRILWIYIYQCQARY